MRRIVYCDGPVLCKELLVLVQIRQLVGFPRICVFIITFELQYAIIADTTHFTSVTFKIAVLVGEN
jgi:hypothetical protein